MVPSTGPVLIQVKARNVVAGKAVGFLEGGNLAAAQKVQSPMFSPDPDIAVGSIGDGADDVGRETVIGGEVGPLLSVPTAQAALRSDPQAAVMPLIKGRNLRIDDADARGGSKPLPSKRNKLTPTVAAQTP